MMKNAIIGALAVLCIYFYYQNEQQHINPKKGDCTIQMKSLLRDEWHDVIFIHGYGDDYEVAKYLVDLTEENEEMRGGRPKGSFRVKIY
jgi:hypothetical protein